MTFPPVFHIVEPTGTFPNLPSCLCLSCPPTRPACRSPVHRSGAFLCAARHCQLSSPPGAPWAQCSVLQASVNDELTASRLGICPGKVNCSNARQENHAKFTATPPVHVLTSFVPPQSAIRGGTAVGIAHWHLRRLQLREVRGRHYVTQPVSGPSRVLPNLYPCQTLLSDHRTLSC